MNRKRRKGENFEAYRKNLRAEERWLKQRLRGRVLFHSVVSGRSFTYVRAKHGPLS